MLPLWQQPSSRLCNEDEGQAVSSSSARRIAHVTDSHMSGQTSEASSWKTSAARPGPLTTGYAPVRRRDARAILAPVLKRHEAVEGGHTARRRTHASAKTRLLLACPPCLPCDAAGVTSWRMVRLLVPRQCSDTHIDAPRTAAPSPNSTQPISAHTATPPQARSGRRRARTVG